MASCSKSNGKVEYRKTETGCLEIPDMLFRDPNLKDTTMRMDGILDEYTLKLLAENSKAKFLYEKRKQVESESEAAYLINTSSSNIISFTIKSISNDIVPIAEFKAGISKWFKSIQKAGHPLIITQNGKPAGVLLSPSDYDELVYKKAFLDSVSRGISDTESGNTAPRNFKLHWVREEACDGNQMD